jgi:integrase
MTVRLIKNSWWVDFTVDYIRYRKRSPKSSRADALAYEGVLRHRLSHGQSITGKPDGMGEERQTFEEFAWRWFEEYAVPNNKYSEQHTKKYTLRAWLVPFFGKLVNGQITTRHVEQYKARALKSGLSRKTVNNHLSIFRTCVTTAYDWLQLQGTPPKIAWLKVRPPVMDYLSADECTLILSHADGIVREKILTALRTGMRQGELKGLQWSSIDWQNQSLAIRHSQCDYAKELTSPKSNRERHIPMDVDVYEMLIERKRDTGYVFLDTDGRPFNAHRMACRLARVQKKTGLRKIGWHTLRHTFASHLVGRGVPLTAVQILMGHSNVSTTMRYAHLAPSTLRAAIDLLNPKTMFAADVRQPAVNRWLESLQARVEQKPVMAKELDCSR